MKIQNKVFVVTGGGNGIGREVVLNLLKKGAKVAALDISEKGLEETVKLSESYSSNLTTHKIDITNKQQVESLPEEIIKHHSTIDGVINVAGIIQPFVKVNELNYEQIERVMNVNFYGTVYMVKTFLPHLLNKDTTAYICNVSSMGGFLPVPGQSVYGASKAAVKLFTEGLYAELKNTNVRVNIVFPGAVATEITKNSNVEVKSVDSAEASKFKAMPADQAASIIVNGMIKEKFRTIVGKDSGFMDKFYRFNPRKAVNMITNKMASLLN